MNRAVVASFAMLAFLNVLVIGVHGSPLTKPIREGEYSIFGYRFSLIYLFVYSDWRYAAGPRQPSLSLGVPIQASSTVPERKGLRLRPLAKDGVISYFVL